MPTEAEPTSTRLPSGSRNAHGSPSRNFLRHYGEMLVAMFLGMLVLGVLSIVGVLVSNWNSEGAGAFAARNGIHHDSADGRLDASPRLVPDN